MREVCAFEATMRLSALLDDVAAGETVMITKRGSPVARLVPVDDRERWAVDGRSRVREECLRHRSGSVGLDALAIRLDELAGSPRARPHSRASTDGLRRDVPGTAPAGRRPAGRRRPAARGGGAGGCPECSGGVTGSKGPAERG